MPQPVLIFDVIETLFSLSPLRQRVKTLGLAERDADLLFAQLLRDAFALSATSMFYSFPDIAKASITVFLEGADIEPSPERVKEVLSAFSELPAHPDVQSAFEQAKNTGARIALLTNGTRSNTKKLVRRATLEALVDDIVSVEDIQVWKPQPALYRGACAILGVPPAEATLIAAHAWDVHGAQHAGMNAVWVKRQDRRYHELMTLPLGLARTLPEAVSMALSTSDKQ